MLHPASRFFYPQALSRSRTSQRGVILVLMLLVFISGASLILLQRLNDGMSRRGAEVESRQALAQAKRALIAWAVSHPEAPGLLPWPDRGADAEGYDGNPDCATSGSMANTALFFGVLPTGDMTHGPCLDLNADLGVSPRDGSGARLWYAVSRNLVRDYPAGAYPVINSRLYDQQPPGATNAYPWLTVRDARGNVISTEVAAVIIAPGAAINTQVRSFNAAPANYLDSTNIASVTHDNADANEDFIAATNSDRTAVPDDNFNDQLIYITVSELMQAVEQRVLGEVARTLLTYRTDPDADDAGGVDPDCPLADTDCDDAFPWLTGVLAADDPGDVALNLDGVVGERKGLLPIWEPANTFIPERPVDWSAITGGSIAGAGSVQPDPACVRSLVCNEVAQDLDWTAGWFTNWSCNWANAPDYLDLTCTASRVNPASTGIGPYTGGEFLRTITISLSFDVMQILPPDAGFNRARGISVAVGTAFAPILNEAASTIVIIDSPAGDPAYAGGIRTLTLDNAAAGAMQLTLPYDLEVAANGVMAQPGQLPFWFDGYTTTDSNWERLVYVAYPDAEVLPGTSDTVAMCTAGTDCLSICVSGTDCPADGGGSAVDDIRALAIIAGRSLTVKGDDRAASPNLGDYLDDENASPADETFARRSANNTFNDQLRIILER